MRFSNATAITGTSGVASRRALANASAAPESDKSNLNNLPQLQALMTRRLEPVPLAGSRASVSTNAPTQQTMEQGTTPEVALEERAVGVLERQMASGVALVLALPAALIPPQKERTPGRAQPAHLPYL